MENNRDIYFHDSTADFVLEYQNESMPDDHRTHDDSQDQDNPFGEAGLLCGVLMILVAVIGLASNVTTVRIFTHRPLVSSINTLLAGLAIADAALLISGVPLYSSVAFFTYLTSVNENASTATLEQVVAYMTVYIYPFTSIFQTASVWTMVLITVERYIAVVHPFAARTACTWRRAVAAIILVNVSSIFYNISRFFEYEIKYKNLTESGEIDNNKNLEKQETMVEAAWALRNNRDYMNIYGHWLYFIFLFALPFSVLLLLNTMVVITIRRANRFRASLSRRQCKEHATASMMVIVALFFLACNCLGCILNAMDVFGLSLTYDHQAHVETSQSSRDTNETNSSLETDSEKSEEMPQHTPLFYFLIDLSNLLVMIHCSCNFFIYLTFSKRFRNFFCLLSPFCRFRQRRLADLKSGCVFERDPLSTISTKKRRSCVTSIPNEDIDHYELQLIPVTPTTPIAPSPSTITKMNWVTVKKGNGHWTFTETPEMGARQYHQTREHLSAN